MTEKILMTIIAALPSVCACLIFWGEARRYRSKYRQALIDLLAFHRLEERYVDLMRRQSPLHVGKRAVRILQRETYKTETPSSLATPQNIKNELAKLGIDAK